MIKIEGGLRAITGVLNPLNTGRYLGLPSLIGREKRVIFTYIKDRLWKKLQGWSGRKISKIGKEVFIKSVAQAILSYCMTTFFLPSLCWMSCMLCSTNLGRRVGLIRLRVLSGCVGRGCAFVKTMGGGVDRCSGFACF